MKTEKNFEKSRTERNPPCFFEKLLIAHCSAAAAKAVIVTATAIVTAAAAVIAAAAAEDYNEKDYPATAAVSAKKSIVTHN